MIKSNLTIINNSISIFDTESEPRSEPESDFEFRVWIFLSYTCS